MRGAAQPAVLKKPGYHAGTADSTTKSREARLSASSAVVHVGRVCVTAGNKLGAVRQRSVVECRASSACQPSGDGDNSVARCLHIYAGELWVLSSLLAGCWSKDVFASASFHVKHLPQHMPLPIARAIACQVSTATDMTPAFAREAAGASKLWCCLQTAARGDLLSQHGPALPSPVAQAHTGLLPLRPVAAPPRLPAHAPPCPRLRPGSGPVESPCCPPAPCHHCGLRRSSVGRARAAGPGPTCAGAPAPGPRSAAIARAAAGMRGAAAALAAGPESGPGPRALPKPPAGAAAPAPSTCRSGAGPASAPAGSAPWAAAGGPAAPPSARHCAASASMRPCRYAARPGSCTSSGLPPAPPLPASPYSSHSSTEMTCARAHGSGAAAWQNSASCTMAAPGACFLYGHRRESRTRARTRGQPLHSDSRICLRQVAPRDQPCTRTRAPARSSRRPATIAPPGGWRWTSNRSSVACTHTLLKFPLNEPRLPPHPPGESRTLKAQAASSLRTAAPQQHTQRVWS